MGLFDGKTPAERNKLIAAIAFGAFAVFLLARMFLSAPAVPPRPTTVKTTTGRTITTTTTTAVNGGATTPDESLLPPRPLVFIPAPLNVPEAARNIFAYNAGSATGTPRIAVTSGSPVVANVPTPTPTPPPPLMLSSLAPVNVFARTGDFALQVSGDKFTPQTRVFLDGQELPTRFINAQQLSADVSASAINAPGARQIVARTPDGQLYSNGATLNISPPPTPPFTYVGLLGTRRYSDTALLKNQSNEVVSVQRGDVVGGRFRVTGISDRAVEFTDAQLKIKHTLPYVESRAGVGVPNGPGGYTKPPPNNGSDDDDSEP